MFKMGCSMAKKILAIDGKNASSSSTAAASSDGGAGGSCPSKKAKDKHTSHSAEPAPSGAGGKTKTSGDELGDFSKLQDDPRIPLNVRQIFKITKSWKAIARTMSKTGTAMFLNLFEQNADLFYLFHRFQHLKGTDLHESMELREHASTVMATLDQSINSLSDYDNFVTYLHSIGKLHRKVPDFRRDHFWKIEQPFLKAVKQTLDERCNETIEEIYKIAIKLIIETIADGYGEDSPSKSARTTAQQPPTSGGPSDGSSTEQRGENPPSNNNGNRRTGGGGSSSLAPCLYVNGGNNGNNRSRKNGLPSDCCVPIENDDDDALVCGYHNKRKFSCETGNGMSPTCKHAGAWQVGTKTTVAKWAAPNLDRDERKIGQRISERVVEVVVKEGGGVGGSGESLLVAGEEGKPLVASDDHHHVHLNRDAGDVCNEQASCVAMTPLAISDAQSKSEFGNGQAKQQQTAAKRCKADVDGTRLKDTLSVLRELLLLLTVRKNEQEESRALSVNANTTRKRRLDIIRLGNKRTCLWQSIEKPIQQRCKLPKCNQYNPNIELPKRNEIEQVQISSSKIQPEEAVGSGTTLVDNLEGFGQLNPNIKGSGTNEPSFCNESRNASRCSHNDLGRALGENSAKATRQFELYENCKVAQSNNNNNKNNNNTNNNNNNNSNIESGKRDAITCFKQLGPSPMAPLQLPAGLNLSPCCVNLKFSHETEVEPGTGCKRLTQLGESDDNKDASESQLMCLAKIDEPRTSYDRVDSCTVSQPDPLVEVFGSSPGTKFLTEGSPAKNWPEPTNRAEKFNPFASWPVCGKPPAPLEADALGRIASQEGSLDGSLATYYKGLGLELNATRDNGTAERRSKEIPLKEDQTDKDESMVRAHIVSQEQLILYHETEALSARTANESQIRQSSSLLNGNEQIRWQNSIEKDANLMKRQLTNKCHRLSSPPPPPTTKSSSSPLIAERDNQINFDSTNTKKSIRRRRRSGIDSSRYDDDDDYDRNDSCCIRPLAIRDPVSSILAKSKSQSKSASKHHKFTLTSDLNDLTELIKMLMLTVTSRANTNTADNLTTSNTTSTSTMLTSNNTMMPAIDELN